MECGDNVCMLRPVRYLSDKGLANTQIGYCGNEIIYTSDAMESYLKDHLLNEEDVEFIEECFKMVIAAVGPTDLAKASLILQKLRG